MIGHHYSPLFFFFLIYGWNVHTLLIKMAGSGKLEESQQAARAAVKKVHYPFGLVVLHHALLQWSRILWILVSIFRIGSFEVFFD